MKTLHIIVCIGAILSLGTFVFETEDVRPTEAKRDVDYKPSKAHWLCSLTARSEAMNLKDLTVDQSKIDNYNRSIGLSAEGLRWLQRGNEESDKGNFKHAIACFDRAINLHHRYASAFNNRGNARDALGDHLGAEEDYRKAIELNPQFASPHNNLGCLKVAKFDSNKAIEEFNKSICIAPDSVTLDNLGCALQNKGARQAALASFNQAIQMGPTYELAYLHRAELLRSLGDHSGSMRDYQKVVELRPDDPYSYFARGSAYFSCQPQGSESEARLHMFQQRELAIRDFTTAIAIDPLFERAITDRAFAKSMNSDYAGGVQDLSEAIKISPNDAVSYQTRAFMRDRCGDFSGAIRDLDLAISYNTWARADVFFHRANLRAITGDYPGAICDFFRAHKFTAPSRLGRYYSTSAKGFFSALKCRMKATSLTCWSLVVTPYITAGSERCNGVPCHSTDK